nr:hypothetical protein [Salmonella enterica]
MFYVDNGSGIPNMPDIAEKRADTPQWFSEGKGNQQITWPGADFFNMWQAEGLNILAAAGMQPDKTKLNQLALAIKALIKQPTDDITDWAKKQFLAKDQNGGDIPDKQKFIENLGLTETVEQARNAVPSTRKVNGKALTTDITLTSGDIGALPVTGGKLNGPLGIGTDNALGGNSIVFGDNDTGFKQNGDGVLDVYSNSTHVLRFIGNLVESMVSLKVNGNAVATGEVQAGNGTSRMAGNGDIFGNVWNGWLSTHLNNLVADVQLGAGTSVATWNNAGSWPNTPGYVVTSVWKDATDANIDGIVYAPLQKRLGIQWYTVQGGTA